MNSINITSEGYSAPNGVDDMQNNWAAAYAKRVVDEHKTSPVLDHPDGSVTVEKLSQELKAIISQTKSEAENASKIAYTAKTKADVAVASADNAVSEAENAYSKSLDADSKADNAVLIANTAKAKAETAEHRAISAETKADAAVASAAGAMQKAETAQSELSKHSSDTDIHTTAAEKEEINERIDGIFGSIDALGMMATTSIQYWQPNTYYKEGQVVYVKTSIYENPYDAIYKCITTHTSKQDFLPYYEETLIWDIFCGVTAEFTESAGFASMSIETFFAECDLDGNNLVDTYAKKTELETKADKPTITTSTDTALSFEFSTNHNTENRTGELTTISFTFGDGEYAEDYISGLSFDSGETPTAIDYTDSGILNWVGTDCTTFDGLSIFQPSANTHYDIVFYFNGVQFIGLVNGFIPATGNEAA